MLALLKPVRLMIAGTVSPHPRSFLISSLFFCQFALATELYPLGLGLGDAVHLTFPPDVVLKLSDQ